jgi:RNA polymerase sigma factor (sigma-70 family)
MPTGPDLPPSSSSQRAAAAYVAHRRLLTYIARKKFHICDEGEVLALIHDVFLAFIRNEQKIRPTAEDERAWLVGTTCNASRYYWRKRGGDDASPDIPDQPCDPAAVADDAVLRMTLERVLNEIPERCRKVLRLKYAEGYTSEELATSEAVSCGSARNLVSRCLLEARVAFERLASRNP